MGLPNFKSLFFSIILLFSYVSQAQIIFKELPKYKIKESEELFFGTNEKRLIIPLNGEWKVYRGDDEEKKKVSVTVPSIFQGEGELVFEKAFNLSPDQISNHLFELNFFGINYTADILLNDVIIYRHSGGEFPFKLELPRDILKADRPNIISVKLFYKLDSQNTIPVKQRFLFPKSYGGILRDVYIYLMPNIAVVEPGFSYKYNPAANKAVFTVNSKIVNKEFKKAADTLAVSNNFTFKLRASSPEGVSSFSSSDQQFQLGRNKEKIVSQSLEIPSVMPWSPSAPQSYLLTIELWQGDRLIDKINQTAAVYLFESEKDSILINNRSIALNGVTYIPFFNDYGSLATYEQMERDIQLIKQTGFNSVRFIKSLPHPFYLHLCERYGLIAFMDLPINNIPGPLAQSQNFIARSRNYLLNFIKAYKDYSAIAALGVGSGFLPDIESHISLIQNLSSQAKSQWNILTYASFKSFGVREVENLDLYGIEFFNESIVNVTLNFNELVNDLGSGKVFISSATYTVSKGNTDGYTNEHSFEAQAKYFEDLIDFADENNFAGYFINTMFDYKGDFSSLSNGYNKDNTYSIGIAGQDRSTSRIAYNVINSKLHNAEEVTIPIGSSKDDAPMAFIIFGILLAILMGILINSGKKFREDSSRALLRPYNFYADVRDQRIMSGFHTMGLAIVVVAVASLIVSNVLFYWRDNILFEKFLLAFGSPALINAVNFLAWHPVQSLIWLTAAFAVILLLIALLIKTASFFIRNRVYFVSVFYAVVWSLLPLVLLIPLGIILYRILNTEIANLYLYILLVIFAIWIFYRILKGIHVIFDVNAGSVYFYSILIILLFAGGLLVYYELTNAALDYLMFTFKQHNITG